MQLQTLLDVAALQDQTCTGKLAKCELGARGDACVNAQGFEGLAYLLLS